MQTLIELTDQLASGVVLADPSDPANLAALHTQFQSVGRHIGAMRSGHPWAASGGAGLVAAQETLERIILGDVADVTDALAGIRQTVADLQGLIQSAAGGGNPPPMATPEVPPPAPDPEAAGQPAALNADDLPLIREFITEAASHLESAEAAILRLEEDPHNTETVNAIFRSFHTIKGVAGFLNLRQIGQLSHSAETLLDLSRKGQLELAGPAVDVVLASVDQMKALVAELDRASNTGTPLREDPRLEALLARLSDCAAGRASSDAATPARLAPASPTAAEQAPVAAQTISQHNADATVKVSTGRLDSLINMVGELVIAESMVRQGLDTLVRDDPRLARNVAHLGKITRELQDLSMSMRMVPIQGVFQKMARLVRDLARRMGKEIDLSLIGGETELDRNVVEAIADPLVHMVRNSVDHGVETPEDRRAAGKPPTGRVELKAYHHSGNIVIEITDDGRGLNSQRILAKAIAAEIVREDQQLSEEETFGLIFHAGLSTADKLTDVSGRGVGMDVVKRNVEALRGQIDIRSVAGQGSTFTIRLPLTLAVIDGLAVRVGRERYILPITSVEQSIRPRAEQLSQVQGRGEMCLLRGRLMPLVRLHRVFGIAGAVEDPTESLVVIVQDNHRRCCLLVDELLGQQQVVIKSLGDDIGKVPGVSGGAILGDGAVSLILDVPGLIDVASG